MQKVILSFVFVGLLSFFGAGFIATQTILQNTGGYEEWANEYRMAYWRGLAACKTK